METKFQTSFIPKKPIVQDSSAYHAPASTSILMMIALLLFTVSLGGAVFAFVAEGVLNGIQRKHQEDLAENEKRFNRPLIEDLRKANAKIDFAKQLIQNHSAVSETLNIVAALTAEKVYFTDFTLVAPSKGGPDTSYKIAMKGIADGFNSIAFQSDVFGSSSKYGTNKVVKNPILSDLTTDDAGNVRFNFTGEIMPADISYEKVLKAALQEEGLIPGGTTQ